MMVGLELEFVVFKSLLSRNMWELKPEFRHYKEDAPAKKKKDNDSDSDSD